MKKGRYVGSDWSFLKNGDIINVEEHTYYTNYYAVYVNAGDYDSWICNIPKNEVVLS